MNFTEPCVEGYLVLCLVVATCTLYRISSNASPPLVLVHRLGLLLEGGRWASKYSSYICTYAMDKKALAKCCSQGLVCVSKLHVLL